MRVISGTGRQTVVYLLYTTHISVDLAFCKIFRAKVGVMWKDDKRRYKTLNIHNAATSHFKKVKFLILGHFK